ncbi:hypothetical protein CEXT_398291 [Caerostris extrusa]|uniref:Transposase n=1 Tax=Caerostris extrusa TaxID=172846 RepID=A0AAV4W8R4_CAEEX|nr:hypothetical protein CEXT_398291 [Caerostris extrusa]
MDTYPRVGIRRFIKAESLFAFYNKTFRKASSYADLLHSKVLCRATMMSFCAKCQWQISTVVDGKNTKTQESDRKKNHPIRLPTETHLPVCDR